MSKSPAPPVVFLSNQNCNHCRRAKAFLNRHQIPFNEYPLSDINNCGERSDEPMIRIGNQTLKGFDPLELINALRKAGFDV